MWKGLNPGKTEDRVPIGHITNGVHVPSWLAPQMSRLYDRHLGAGWQQHGAEAHLGRYRECRRRRAVGDASQLEITVARIRAQPRHEISRAARRARGDAH
jgi:glucan phosphorylase